jgi:hypothetical protein
MFVLRTNIPIPGVKAREDITRKENQVVWFECCSLFTCSFRNRSDLIGLENATEGLGKLSNSCHMFYQVLHAVRAVTLRSILHTSTSS